ncbi:uncharacterized protein TNCV_293241 [Trichonephila clavipes]|nr:uncharacterized protein TNCV_293241 [Trichonephila clavipes]
MKEFGAMTSDAYSPWARDDIFTRTPDTNEIRIDALLATLPSLGLAISYSDLENDDAGIYFISPNCELESYRALTGKISSNFMCDLMAIKEALDNYHNREIKSSNDIFLFLDTKSAFQVILRDNSQLTQDIIALINRVAEAQRT